MYVCRYIFPLPFLFLGSGHVRKKQELRFDRTPLFATMDFFYIRRRVSNGNIWVKKLLELCENRYSWNSWNLIFADDDEWSINGERYKSLNCIVQMSSFISIFLSIESNRRLSKMWMFLSRYEIHALLIPLLVYNTYPLRKTFIHQISKKFNP